MTPYEKYWLSLIAIIFFSLVIGFLICWPIAHALGYRKGCFDGWKECEDAWFDPEEEEDDDREEVPDTILDAKVIG